MSALFRGIYNLVSLLVLEEDLTCYCTCGRNQVYRVVPYTGSQFTVNSHINWSGGIITQQNADIIFGLLLGLFIFWILLRLDKARLSDCGFWPWMPKFSSIRGFFRYLYPKTMQDSGEDTIEDDEDYLNARDVSDK